MTDAAGPRPGAAIGSDAPSMPDSYVQGEAVTLLTLLEQMGDLGFTGQFEPRDGRVRCLTCHQLSDAAAVPVCDLRRLEGASDPDDMLAVVALRCPHCAAKGTLTLSFGPEASTSDGDVLRALRDPDPDC